MTASLNSLNDEQLMATYVNGNSAAFEALYTRYEKHMLAFIRRTLGINLEAQSEEVYQDAWMRIINARESYKAPINGGASWKTWAFTIAHNIAVDRLRAQNKYATIEPVAENDTDPMEWIQVSVGEVTESSEEKAYWQAAGSKLLECLEILPDEQRAAFLLHHEEDSSIEEMAEILSLPFETLKSRLRYAMQKLRVCMQHYLKEMTEAS